MKKYQLLVFLIAAIAIAGSFGCASKSSENSAQPTTTVTTASQPAKKPKDKRPIEQRLVVGMTMDQVKNTCGKPKDVAMNSDGSTTWVYNDAEKAFIPNYTLFGGRIHFVTVNFDANGKVISWSSGSSGAY